MPPFGGGADMTITIFDPISGKFVTFETGTGR